MADLTQLLAAAAEAATRPRRLFKLLLQAWEQKPAPALAEVFTAASAAFPFPFEGTTADWLKAARADAPERRGGLLAALRGPQIPDTARRLEAARKWGMDPRSSAALEQLLRDVPYTSTSSRRAVWTEAFALMEALEDPRFVELAGELPSAWTVRSEQRSYLVSQLAAAVKRLPQRAPALSATEKQAIAALLACFERPARTGASAAERDEAGLLADVYANPGEDGPRLVYGDFLLEKGDPRGEFIALQFKAQKTGEEKRREGQLLKAHGRKWLGALGPVMGAHFEYRRGFVASGMVKFRHQADAEKYGALPHWATLEELSWSLPGIVPLGQEPWCQFIGPAFRGLRKAVFAHPPHLLAGSEPWALEELTVEPGELEHFLGLFDHPLLPKLRKVRAVVQNPRWIRAIKKAGGVKELALELNHDAAEYLAAASRLEGLEVLELGPQPLRFTRGKDGTFAVLSARLSPQDSFPPPVVSDLPAGLVESYRIEPTRKGQFDPAVPAAFDKLVRKRGQRSPILSAGGFKLPLPRAVIGLGGNRWRVVDDDRILTLEPGQPPSEVPIIKSTAAAFGPDGSWLLSNSARGLVQLNASTGKPSRVLVAKPRHAFSVALTTDGMRAAVAYSDLVECWDLQTGTLLRKVKNMTWARWGAISPDGARVATKIQYEAYGVYELDNLEHGVKIRAGEYGYKGCFLTNDRLLVCDGKKRFCSWDLTRREVLAEAMAGHCEQLQASADGSRVILIDAGVGKILEAVTLDVLATFDEAARIGWDRDGHVLCVNERGVRKLHRDTGKLLARCEPRGCGC